MIEAWTDLVESLVRNRVRSGLTMFSVAWGIFVLVVLLGVGEGLENSVAWSFRDDATNSIWMYPGRTSMPHEGRAIGRRIQYTDEDFARMEALDRVEHITGRFRPPSSTVVWEDKSASFPVRSVHPDHRFLENTLVTEGRFLNPLDLEEHRKVAVIGAEVVRQLFGRHDPMGSWITVNGVRFKVVGTYEDAGGEGEMSHIYVPITTARLAWAGGDRIDQIMFTVGNTELASVQALTDDVRAMLAKHHGFSPQDRRAVRVRNNVERFAQVQELFTLLGAFTWLVGLGTVMAGIVGVSNVMLVSVTERTREIGLRKAMGATPGSIVWMIMQEALLLTSVSGTFGFAAGLAVVEGLRRWLPDNEYLRDPDVALAPALTAVVLLVLFGALAGLFPALRAAHVDPVVALRSE